jgi:hypothetical protein
VRLLAGVIVTADDRLAVILAVAIVVGVPVMVDVDEADKVGDSDNIGVLDTLGGMETTSNAGVGDSDGASNEDPVPPPPGATCCICALCVSAGDGLAPLIRYIDDGGSSDVVGEAAGVGVGVRDATPDPIGTYPVGGAQAITPATAGHKNRTRKSPQYVLVLAVITPPVTGSVAASTLGSVSAL